MPVLLMRLRLRVRWIHSEHLTPKNATELCKGLDGILVAPGFGERGFEGKVATVQYAREQKDPLFWNLLRYASGSDRICT